MGERCHAPQISVRKLDGIVWAQVQTLISSPEKVKEAIRTLAQRRSADRAVNQNTLDSLITRQEDIKKQQQRLFGLYAVGKYDEEGLDNAIESLNLQEQELNRQIQEAENRLKKIDDINTIENEIERLCSEYKERIMNPTPELQKFIVQRWISEINILESGDIRIKMKLPELIEETRRCPSQATLSE